MIVELVDSMSPEDRRMRFFTTVRHLDHAMAARLTQIDYYREIAFVAEREGKIHGVARFSIHAERESCEFAVAVRTEIKGKGLGTALMKMLINDARERKLKRIEGFILRENHSMLAFAQSLGFKPLQKARIHPSFTSNTHYRCILPPAFSHLIEASIAYSRLKEQNNRFVI